MNEEQDNSGPEDSHLFYAVADEAVYEAARAWLDAEFGHPKAGTETCIPPASNARKDEANRPLVAILQGQADWPEVADALEALEASGLIEELTRAQWDAAAPISEDVPPVLQTVRLYICEDLDHAHDISLAMNVQVWRDFDGPNGVRYAVEVPDQLTDYYPSTIMGTVLVRDNGKFVSGNWEPYEP